MKRRRLEKVLYFFLRKFQPMTFALYNTLYHQTKTLIGFWCRRELNPESLIQSLQTLPIKLTGTHTKCYV